MEENPGAICFCGFALISNPCRVICFLCLLDYLHACYFKLLWDHLQYLCIFLLGFKSYGKY